MSYSKKENDEFVGVESTIRIIARFNKAVFEIPIIQNEIVEDFEDLDPDMNRSE